MGDKEIQDIEILEDRSLEGGFLKLSRLVLRNRYKDGSFSEPYDCDLVSRPKVDAVTVLLWQRSPEGRILVGLREGLRAPIFLRRYDPDLPFPDDPPFETLCETVAGILEPGDAALERLEGLRRRAAEECREEAGLEVGEEGIQELGGASFPTPGIGNEKVYFMAAEVDFSEARPPGGDGSVMEEVGGLRVLSLEEALERCRKGEIADMKTEIALARLRDLLPG